MLRSYRVEPESMVVTAFYCQLQSPGFGFWDWGLGLDNFSQ